MTICKVENTTNRRLEQLINEKGQAEGLMEFLREQETPSPISFEEIRADFEMGDIKIKYEYYKSSADSAANYYKKHLGEKAVNVFKSKDNKGRDLWKVSITNPKRIEISDELAAVGDPDKDSFEILLDYMKGQRRIKFNRLSILDRRINETLAKGNNVEKLEKRKLFLEKEIMDLSESIEEFEQTRSIDNIKNMAFSQLNWVASTLEKEDISESEINESMFILDLWERAKEVMFGDAEEIHEDFLTAFSEIKNIINSEDYVGKMWRVVSSYLADLGEFDDAGSLLRYMYKIEDMGEKASLGRDLSTSGNKLINKYEKLLRTTSSRAGLEIRQWEENFKSLGEKLKEAGLEWKDVLQYDSELVSTSNPDGWTGNLINELTQDFYDSQSKMKNRFSNGISTAKTREEGAKVHAEKNKWFKENMNQVDIRFFVSEEFSRGRAAYIKDLYNEYGETKTEEIIQYAKEKHDTYLEDKKTMKEVFDAEVDAGQITAQEGKEFFEEWVSKNNPIIWFNQLDPVTKGEKRVYTQSFNDNYTVKLPKRLDKYGRPTQWYDSKFDRLSESPEFKEVYSDLREDIQEKLNFFPKYLFKNNNIHLGFFPRSRTSMGASLVENAKGFMGELSKESVHGITSPQGLQNRHIEIDPTTQQPYRTVPASMLDNIPVEERSDKVDKVIPAFAKEAINYKWMSSVEDHSVLMNNFLQKIGTSSSRKNFTDNELNALRKSVKYHADALIYGQTKVDEGVTGRKFFKGNSFIINNDARKDEIEGAFAELKKESKDVNKALAELKERFEEDVEIVSEKRKYKHLSKLRDAIEEDFNEGRISKEDYIAKMEPLEAEANSMGRNLVLSKVMDKLLRYNQDLVLGLNVFSGINNYLFGLTSNIVWSGGNTDFSPKHMWTGLGIIWKSMLGTVYGNLDKAAHIIAHYEVVHTSTEYAIDGKVQFLNKLKNFPYIFLKMGDYLIKGHTFIAMALAKKVKDKYGKERSLYDAYDNEGRWKVEEMGENVDWNGDVNNPEHLKEFFNFKAHADDLIKKLHGNFDLRSPTRYKKYILGRMLGQFKFSWMIEGFTQRWEERRDSELMGRAVEGRYTTYRKLGPMKSITSLAKLAVGSKDVFKNASIKDKATFEENMRRNLMEVYMYSIMLGLYFTLKAASDDDDESSKRYITMANILNRIAGDTTLYFNPLTFVHLWREPFALLRLSSRASKAFHSAKDLMIESELTEDEINQKWTNITNSFPYINQYNKFETMSRRVMPLM